MEDFILIHLAYAVAALCGIIFVLGVLVLMLL